MGKFKSVICCIILVTADCSLFDLPLGVFDLPLGVQFYVNIWSRTYFSSCILWPSTIEEMQCFMNRCVC